METIFRHCVAKSQKLVSKLTVIYLVFITSIPSSDETKLPSPETEQ